MKGKHTKVITHRVEVKTWWMQPRKTWFSVIQSHSLHSPSHWLQTCFVVYLWWFSNLDLIDAYYSDHQFPRCSKKAWQPQQLHKHEDVSLTDSFYLHVITAFLWYPCLRSGWKIAIYVQVSPIPPFSRSDTRSDRPPDIIKMNKFPDLRI